MEVARVTSPSGRGHGLSRGRRSSTSYSPLAPRHSLLATRSSPLASRFSPLASRFSLLASRFSQLIPLLGKLLYRYKQRFGHGFRVAWYRDVVRQRILDTPPVEADDSSVAEIHVLTSEKDWLNLIWALKSFYWASKRRYALCIHDDGTLNDEIRGTLRKHFPAARVIDRRQSQEAVMDELASYPKCREFRETNPLSPKVFDFRHYLRRRSHVSGRQ